MLSHSFLSSARVIHLVCFRSLESKLETLKAERGDDCQVDNDCSQTESPVPCQKSDAVVCSSKETSKDGLSAGSFTRETRTHWSPVTQIPAAVAAEEMETKTEGLLSSEQEKVSSSEKITAIVCGGQVGSLKKRRGKRKRKDCSRDVKEGSVGESDFLGVPDAKPVSRRKENSTPVSGQFARSSGADDQSGSLRKDSIDDIKGVFESVAQNESAFVFRHRLDSQVKIIYLYTFQKCAHALALFYVICPNRPSFKFTYCMLKSMKQTKALY